MAPKSKARLLLSEALRFAVVSRGLARFFLGLILSLSLSVSVSVAVDRDASQVEILSHEWHLAEKWSKIGKTKYVWRASIRNNSDRRKRVYVYYYLLDAEGQPLARNVANRYIKAHQSAEIVANSYIHTFKLERIVRSEVRFKVGYPN